MSDAKTLHHSFNLYITNDDYIFEPTDIDGKPYTDAKRSLSISRHSGDVVLNPLDTPPPQTPDRAITVYGILGIISLSAAEYLIVITSRTPRGRISNQPVYLANDFRLLPIAPPTYHALIDHPVEKHLLALVENHLSTGKFWFSYGWDLTRRLQAQHEDAPKDEGKAMWEMADDRFFWNKYLQSKFIDITTSNPEQDLSSYILPVIYGSFDLRPTRIGRANFHLVLISRRSRYRAGTRYFTRGIDSSGNVGNFNESEQILLVDEEADGVGISPMVEGNTRMSYVQTRGSVPIFWAEVNTLRYKPDLQIMDMAHTLSALKQHLSEQLKLYGTQTLVNLVNQKGHEKPVKDAFEQRIEELKMEGVQYEYFDFHNECKHMRWDRIGILIDRLEESLVNGGYFHQTIASAEPLKTQTATVRTNCMDCLDRTNVVQSALAKWMLTRQLRAVGVLDEKSALEDYAEFMNDFRGMWADHADYVSKAYSGTGALKTDFTRTGKRTREGAFQDFCNSAMRYIRNNFFDGERQDAFDLITGTWVPRKGPAASFFIIMDTRPLIVRSMPYALLFSILMIFAGVSLPRSSDYSLFWYNILWLVVLSLSLIYIFAHGIKYVSWPRLNPPVATIFYEGPGFRGSQSGRGLKLPFGLEKVLEKQLARAGQQMQRPLLNQKIEEIEMGTKKE
ncbi:hypothetical protein BOTBODRAFT_53873 [Botryobasidium botryosum FD-172 SS1]|uniref:SAC domain-containing protein n=1 Tax=Botryobasidium botryosum (strain FD-172 SS1) TaxID=930990 RepID=A0A067MQ66_BOTB1|nr:hypothetical protein BOTBODRAFT_53873 [Botryobasidium botryosum FD-172 SS1]